MGNTEQEFTYLIEKHKSVIYTVCLMFSKDRDEIDDELLPQSAEEKEKGT